MFGRLGMNDFLAKPLKQDVLRGLLKKISKRFLIKLALATS